MSGSSSSGRRSGRARGWEGRGASGEASGAALGHACKSQGGASALERAVSAYQTSLELVPSGAGAYAGLAYALKEVDPSRAAKAFEAACKVDPECPTGYFNLAVTQKRQGEVVQAAAMYLIAQKSMEPGSEHWARATACAFDQLRLLLGEQCERVGAF